MTRDRDEVLLAALRSAASPDDGALEARYELLEKVSEGGQASVHRAVQRGTRRPVAIKRLHRAAGMDRWRFAREAELAARLQHPNVVTTYEAGVDGALPWIAMEWIDGRQLDVWADEAPRSRRTCAALVARLARAVAYAHRMGVLHRDVKPANVLVDREGEPHLCDFGIANALADGAERAARTGAFTGTPAYASPEQREGDRRRIDTRTDVYSLGVILHELVTGARPEDGRAAQTGDRDLDAVLARVLATEPEGRYATADALAEDLERWAAGEPVAARVAGAGERTLRWARRNARRLVAAAVLVAVGCAGAAALLAEHLRAERQRAGLALVRQVLDDVIAAAAPGPMEPEPRLLEVLESVAPTLRDGLATGPDVLADIQVSLGRTFVAHRRFREAAAALELAAARMDELGVEGERLAECLQLLGEVRATQSEPGAVPPLERALALRLDLHGPDDRRTLSARRALAGGLLEAPVDDGERARAILASMLPALERGGDDLEIARARLALARVDRPHRRSHVEAALAALDRSQAEHPLRVDALMAHAVVLRDAGELAVARVRLEEARELAERVHGRGRTTSVLREMARLEFVRGDHAAAEQLTRAALACELEVWADRSDADAPELRALARRISAAEGPYPYVESFRALRRMLGDGAFELASWSNGLVEVLLAQGHAEPCIPMLREALAIRCRAYGDDCPVRQRTINVLTRLYVERGEHAAAIPLLDESIENVPQARRDGLGGHAGDARAPRRMRARGRLT